MPRPYDLPSMTALVCFEAAARHLSFKQAASELNVTPAAVSHQIRALESELAAPLFRRQYRGVELTEAGAWLFLALQRGFETMSEAVAELRGRAEAADVTVQATTAMSAFWLTPRLSAFWQSHPEIVVSQIVSDVAATAGRPDLSIRYGALPEDGGDHSLLFRDRILAIGAPGYATRHALATAADLLEAPLIHMSGEESRWTGWDDWFGALGLGSPTGRRLTVNNYMIALQLAQDSAGAVLGWEGLVRPLIDQGRLIPLVDESIPSPESFYLTVHAGASAKARIFRDWLVAKGIGAPSVAPTR